MKLPRLWRKKRANGKLYGSYHATVAGADVNLGTSDANEARERLTAAVKKGKRKFPDEMDEAAAAVDGVPEAPPAAPPPLTTPPDPQAQPIVPDAVIPPQRQLPPVGSAEDARAEAEATNEAAANLGGDAGPANDNGAPGFTIDPSFFESMLDDAALGIVELQLQLQAFVIAKKFKRAAGEIPPDHMGRQIAAKAWGAQLRLWCPAVDPPPWVIALGVPLALSVQQFATGQPLPKEPDQQENQPEEPAQAAQ